MSHLVPMSALGWAAPVAQAIIKAPVPWSLDITNAFDGLSFEVRWWICRWESRTRMSRLQPGTLKHILLKQDEDFFEHFTDARESHMVGWRKARVTGNYGLLPFSPVDEAEMECFRPDLAEPAILQQIMGEATTSQYNHSLTESDLQPVVTPPLEAQQYYPWTETSTPSIPYSPTSPPITPPLEAQECYPSSETSTPRILYSPTSPPITPPLEAQECYPSSETSTPRILYSPTSSTISSPLPSEPETVLSPPPYRVIEPPPKPRQFTGNWEDDAIANLGLASSSEVPPPPGPVRPRKVQPQYPRGTRPSVKTTDRETGRFIKNQGRPSGPGMMACNFCRGRKISCRPDDDDENKTCNQCSRRDLDCEYPTENRRGMRRTKFVLSP